MSARRLRSVFAGVALALVLGAGAGTTAAVAHPLGNFTLNHQVQVRISADRIDLRYVLDQAEIPTFQDRKLPEAERLAAVRAQVAEHLTITVDGREVAAATLPGSNLRLLPGQGGLSTTRVEIPLRVTVSGARRVTVRDATYADRLGWRAIVAQAGDGTDVRSSVPSVDVTNGLRRYPEASLQTPSDERVGTFSAQPGSGQLTAPDPAGGAATTTRSESAADGFAGVFANAAAGKGVLLLMLLASFCWGALHALSPGHGKAMVAAYLVGSRGTSRDAVALGLVVTVTHTIGVFALGLVTLALAQYILPEDLYPWLNIASGLLVVTIGGAILWSRVRSARGRRAGRLSSLIEHDHGHADGDAHGHDHADGEAHRRDHARREAHAHAHADGEVHAHAHADGEAHAHAHADGEAHAHAHAHGEAHTHDHGHAGQGHSHSHGGHSHDHHVPRDITWKGILGMGASAGLIPCPSALVVLLAAVSQHQVGLGLALIVAFSVGLAATLSVLGIVVVHAGRFSARLNVSGPLTRWMPAASAVVILGLGLVLTGRALPGVL